MPFVSVLQPATADHRLLRHQHQLGAVNCSSGVSRVQHPCARSHLQSNNMDVFEALGLDMPDNTRSMSVTDADADLAGVLGPLFGWDEKDASANSLILFPGESQQGLGELGLFELPSFKLSQRDEQQLASAAQLTKADPNKASPFSGISQFDLYLGNQPSAEQAAGTVNTSLAPQVVPEGTFAASQPAGAAPAGPELQTQFSQGLLSLLEDTLGPLGLNGEQLQQQQQPQQQQHHQPQQQDGDVHVKVEQQQPASLQAQPQSQLTQQPEPLHAALSRFGAVLPQQLLQQQQQQVGVSSSNLVMPPGAAPAALAGTQQQQQAALMPPPLPQLPVQQQGQQQLAAAVLLQQQQGQPQQSMAFQPVLSPLLLQPQQLNFLTGNANAPMAMPQFNQQLSPLMPQHMPQQQPAGLQQQQQQMEFQFGLSDGDDDDVDDNKHHGQFKRRGRPPKVPGQYSKGYEAIKRYREKKKGMVEHMEAEIAQKRSELQKLEAEQIALRSHQQALESTMNNQDMMLAQLLQLKLSIAGREDNAAPDLEATTAAAIAGVRQAMAMQNGGDAAAEQAAAAAASAQQNQKLLDKKQLAQKKVMEEGPVFLRRYQAYVQAVADRLSAAAAASGSSASVSAAAVTGSFPTFPFTLVETLSLWTLSRLAIMTRTNFAKLQGAQGGSSGAGNEEAWDDFTLNLATGQHDLVPEAFWRDVASKVPLFEEQPVQLNAAWRLYVHAMNALNQERQQLLLKLQEAAAAEEAANVPAWAGPLGDNSSSGSSSAAAAAAGAGTSTGHLTAGSSRGSTVAAAAAGVDRRSGTAALDVATVYLDLLDAVDRNLLRGRAVVMMFGWSMLCMLSAEQIGLVCVHSWPYFPLIRAIVGYMLGKEDFVP